MMTTPDYIAQPYDDDESLRVTIEDIAEERGGGDEDEQVVTVDMTDAYSRPGLTWEFGHDRHVIMSDFGTVNGRHFEEWTAS